MSFWSDLLDYSTTLQAEDLTSLENTLKDGLLRPAIQLNQSTPQPPLQQQEPEQHEEEHEGKGRKEDFLVV